MFNRKLGKSFGALVLAVMLLSPLAQAAVVTVTVESDKPLIQFTEKATITVSAEVSAGTENGPDDVGYPSQEGVDGLEFKESLPQCAK